MADRLVFLLSKYWFTAEMFAVKLGLYPKSRLILDARMQVVSPFKILKF